MELPEEHGPWALTTHVWGVTWAVGSWGGGASRAAPPLCINHHWPVSPLGNLLSSLMGSSEQEEGEESQDDSSPIELD